MYYGLGEGSGVSVSIQDHPQTRELWTCMSGQLQPEATALITLLTDAFCCRQTFSSSPPTRLPKCWLGPTLTMHLSWLGEPRSTVVAPPRWTLVRAVSSIVFMLSFAHGETLCRWLHVAAWSSACLYRLPLLTPYNLLVCYSLLIKNLLVFISAFYCLILRNPPCKGF